MKLVWSPELASKAYIHTVKTCESFRRDSSSIAELISAMAAGWNAGLIVETWSLGCPIATSIGLIIASIHTGGRHVCIVPDDESADFYRDSIRLATGETPNVLVGLHTEKMTMSALTGIDFLLLDCSSKNDLDILRVAKLGHRGAVLVCKNANSKTLSDFGLQSVLGGESRKIVRSAYLPVGNGLDIAHVAAESSAEDAKGNVKGKGKGRWFKHVNPDSGEHLFIRK
ncbi:uncharacterized protein LOC124910139 [Impatiens glandulifera]|uniref:uncharacterized protein LOC124910139 n=1 Tax=Impatiens glandulifera TaxID=253017 RepID=UPI001FB11833|nr:uncharacterized protein LOC124910139 [Impatiens glandulifera]